MATVLLVDADPDRRALVGALLRDHDVVAAEDGPDAIRLSSFPRHLDVVLLAADVPTIPAIEVVRLLRTRQRRRDLTIVVLTDDHHAAAGDMVLAAGADAASNPMHEPERLVAIVDASHPAGAEPVGAQEEGARPPGVARAVSLGALLSRTGDERGGLVGPGPGTRTVALP